MPSCHLVLPQRDEKGRACSREAGMLTGVPSSPESLCGPCSVSLGCIRKWEMLLAAVGCWLPLQWGDISGEFLIPPVTRTFLRNHLCPLRSLQNLTSSTEVLPVFVKSGFSFFFSCTSSLSSSTHRPQSPVRTLWITGRPVPLA